MTSPNKDFVAKLHDCCVRYLGGAAKELTRLQGGANCEMWVFTIGAKRYVLRKSVEATTPIANPTTQELVAQRSQRDEAQLLQHVAHHAADVPVPHIHYICTDDDGLGDSFIMEHIVGETIARKILRDEAFEAQRPQLAAQCGRLLAHIHNCPIPSDLVPQSSARDILDMHRARLEQHAHPHPVFELAFGWLEAHCPKSGPNQLVHGDFRNGNLMISPKDGIVAVLDWELAYSGDGMADLGWLCVPSWRFGVLEKPVGGFGERAALFDAYESAGGQLDKTAARFWEILGTLKWGIICTSMGDMAVDMGYAIERAAIGRRASETEIDLLYYLEAQLDAG